MAMLPKFQLCQSLQKNFIQSCHNSTLTFLSIVRHYGVSADDLPDRIAQVVRNSESIQTDQKSLFRDYWTFMSNGVSTANSILRKIPVDSIVGFVEKNKLRSSTVRGFYRRELIYNINDDLGKAKELITQLRLSKPSINSKNDILKLCIQDCLQTKDVMIATDLYLLYYKLYPEEPLRNDLCHQILSALAFENPRYDHIHLLKFLALDDLYEARGSKITLTLQQIVTICNKALALEHSPILTKNVLNRVMDIELTPIEHFRNANMIAAYHLIERDYAKNNAAGVYLTWTTIKNYYTSMEKHDPRIIYKVLKIFSHHRAYRAPCNEIVSSLRPEYYSNNPLLLPTLIDYATKIGSLTLAKDFMNNVNGYLEKNNTQVVLFSKRCLSSLLRMHLKFKDSSGVDRVLKQILETFGKHSEENLAAIVDHLVEVKSLENFTKAFRLVETFSPKRALLAYGSIINKIVEWQIASDTRFDAASLPIIDKLLQMAHTQDPNHKSSLWSIIASLYIKKIVHYRNFQRKVNLTTDGVNKRKLVTTNLDLAKLIYLRSKEHVWKFDRIDINPFMRSSPHRVILKITDSNRFIILRNIALSAIKGKRRDVFQWCCSELYQHGMPVEELVLDWNIMLNHKLRRVTFHDRKQLDEQLALDRLPFISTNLK